MKKIYLILMHTKTIPSKIVKIFTRYEYSHVAISLDKECQTVYSFGRRNVNSILNSGLSIEEKTGEFFKKFCYTKCKIYELEITDNQYENIGEMLNNMKKNIDQYKYDFLGIIPRFLNIPLTFKNKFVCSFFVAYILDKNNIYKFDKNICLMKPKDFENLDGFSKIYEGLYLSY